jgi:ferredoxin
LTIDRRSFITAAAAGAVTAALPAGSEENAEQKAPRPHRSIDQDLCIACGSCVPLCPMGAITLRETSQIDPHECAECCVCYRSRVCPVDAIVPGKLKWPRTLRETFSNPLATHEDTGVAGRGTEGIKSNDSSGRYGSGDLGVFVELGRPVLGARFRDVERVVKRFTSNGFPVNDDNPVAGLVLDRASGALKPEILEEKAISVLLEFIVPRNEVGKLTRIIDELDNEVETVFNVCVAVRADSQGRSPLNQLFGDSLFTLPNGKVNLGLAKGIEG